MPEVSPLAMPSPGLSIPSGSLVTPSGSAGPPGPGTPSANTGNMLISGSDALLYLPSTTIWGTRLRSFNAVGNSTFEVDQINCGTVVTYGSGSINNRTQDRWTTGKAGTMTFTAQQLTGLINIPGTNFALTNNFLRYTLTAQETSLGVSDFWFCNQAIEQPLLREWINDVHSLQVLVRSSVANFIFGVVLRTMSSPSNISLPVTLTTPATPNTWGLLTLPNQPAWSGGANTLSFAPGAVGYYLSLILAAGSNLLSPSTGSWYQGAPTGVQGQGNFAAQAVNSTFDIAFIQHEPGSVCTTPLDLDFITNHDRCLRYFHKTYGYNVKPGTVDSSGAVAITAPSTASTLLLTPMPFRKVMAKLPTVVAYSVATGASGNIRDTNAGVDRAVSSYYAIQDSGWNGLTAASACTASGNIQWHWTADTGW